MSVEDLFKSVTILQNPEELIGKTISKIYHMNNMMYLLLKGLDGDLYIDSIEGGSFYDSEYIRIDDNPLSIDVLFEFDLITKEEVDRVFKEEEEKLEQERIANMKKQYEHLKNVLGGLGIV